MIDFFSLDSFIGYNNTSFKVWSVAIIFGLILAFVECILDILEIEKKNEFHYTRLLISAVIMLYITGKFNLYFNSYLDYSCITWKIWFMHIITFSVLFFSGGFIGLILGRIISDVIFNKLSFLGFMLLMFYWTNFLKVF